MSEDKYKQDVTDNKTKKTVESSDNWKQDIIDPNQVMNASNDSEFNEQNDTSNECSGIDNESAEKDTNTKNKKINLNVYKYLRIVCLIGFIVFTALFINEILIQPYRTNKAIERTKNLYQKTNSTPTSAPPTKESTPKPKDPEDENHDEDNSESEVAIQDPNRDDKGRLLQFSKLLNENDEVKGWLTIPDTNIDYVVMQPNSNDPEYYLSKNMYKEDDKAGSLFLDYKSSIENNTQNLVIHGHNMTSTDNMFHYLMKYKDIDYYRDRPTFTFDSIYQTGQWKIFAIIVTNGTSKKEALFDYTSSTFKNSSDFLNFVYQLRIRSIYNIDTVDINENDQLLMLSTCSYEVKDYRTVIIARRVRDGENSTVEVERIIENPEPLYPDSWYYRYGGKAPKTAATFEEALEAGEINWYIPENNK